MFYEYSSLLLVESESRPEYNVPVVQTLARDECEPLSVAYRYVFLRQSDKEIDIIRQFAPPPFISFLFSPLFLSPFLSPFLSSFSLTAMVDDPFLPPPSLQSASPRLRRISQQRSHHHHHHHHHHHRSLPLLHTSPGLIVHRPGHSLFTF